MEDLKAECLKTVEKLIEQCKQDSGMYGYTKGFVMGLYCAELISPEENETLQDRIDESNRLRHMN